MKLWVFIIGLLGSILTVSAETAPTLTPEAVPFRSGDQILHGCVYKPKGKGPFPAVLFNQSAIKPSYEKIEWPPFLSLAQFFTTNGYVFFLPGRYNHEIPASSTVPKWSQETDARNADVVAGLDWLKTQSYVDENRIVLCGHSAGAIQALLVAEKKPGIRGTISFSVGAISWKSSTILQELLEKAAKNIDTPVLLLQPQNDFSIEPSRVLGDIVRKKPQPTRVKIFPPFGSTQAEANLFGLNGAKVWGNDVLEFLDRVAK